MIPTWFVFVITADVLAFSTALGLYAYLGVLLTAPSSLLGAPFLAAKAAQEGNDPAPANNQSRRRARAVLTSRVGPWHAR